jgi:hypothetical protein
MENFQLCYEEEVKQQICTVHHMSPSLSLVDGQIALQCCCTEFKIKCYKIIIEALSMYKKDYPVKKLRVANKKISNDSAE